MRKPMLISMAAIVAASVWATAAAAAPKEEKPHGSMQEAVGDSATRDQSQIGKPADKTKSTGEKGEAEKTTVTESTYGNGHKGYIGLQKAYENVKDTPAGKVIAELLESKYGIDVEADEALSELADKTAAEGDVETAIELQKEAVKADVTNLESYKKLGKLYAKLGKAGVKAYVNGVEPKFEIPPFIKDGSTLVPFRAISEALKAEVQWNAEERSVTVIKNGITVKLLIGSTTAYVNGKEVTLEVPAEIIDGNTVVPARFVSESLKATVQWEPESQSVVIYEE